MIASIYAKYYRDKYVLSLHKEIPNYDWDNNMGYATAKHKDLIKKFGLSKYHRNFKIKLSS